MVWGIRIIVPQKYQSQLLAELHTGHMRIVRMKAIARSYVYWPNIDLDIEMLVKGCSGCASTSKIHPLAELHPWEYPSTKWSHIHLDFAGPFIGHICS